MQQTLEYQADQIEMVLQTHRNPGRVTGGVVTPRWVSYQITPAIGSRVSQITRLSEEIALRLGATGVRISRKGPSIQIEVPREDAKAVRLLNLCRDLTDVPKQSAILGLGENGAPILLRLPSPEVAHALVAGTTGSGKTALARSMILSLAMYNRMADVQLVLIDPKGRGFGPLSQIPHLLRPIVDEVHRAVFLLAELVEEMIRRDQEGVSEPRIVVFIDEVADLMDQGGNAVGRLLTRLTQRGRSAGIHIIACTQKPLAASIGSLTKSNFPVRLVGSVTSATDAKVAAGIPNTGAEKLLGRGDFLIVAKGQVMRFQAAYAGHSEINTILAQINANQKEGRRWLAEESPVALADTGTDGKKSSWWPLSKGKISRNQDHHHKNNKSLRAFFGTQLRLIK